MRFDKTHHSVDARAVGRPVEIRACADRLEWNAGRMVRARHDRAFGRGKTIYGPLHYIPVLTRKPGGDRQVVEILGARSPMAWTPLKRPAPRPCLNVHSAGVILNIPARHPRTAATPDNRNAGCLKLGREPAANCDRYDIRDRSLRWSPQALVIGLLMPLLDGMGRLKL